MADEVGKGGYQRAATSTPHRYYGLAESVLLAAFKDAYSDETNVRIYLRSR